MDCGIFAVNIFDIAIFDASASTNAIFDAISGGTSDGIIRISANITIIASNNGNIGGSINTSTSDIGSTNTNISTNIGVGIDNREINTNISIILVKIMLILAHVPAFLFSL